MSYFQVTFILVRQFTSLFHCLLTSFAAVEKTLVLYLSFAFKFFTFVFWSSAVPLWYVFSYDFFLFIFLGSCAFWIWQFWKILMYYLNSYFCVSLCCILDNLFSCRWMLVTFSPQSCLINLIFSPHWIFFCLFQLCFSFLEILFLSQIYLVF